MPTVEVASFTLPKSLLSESTDAMFDRAIGPLKKINGCLSVHRGYQLDDKSNKFIVVVWESYDKIAAPQRKDFSPLWFELEKLDLSLHDLSIRLFLVNDDPAPILDSPLPALRFTTPTPGHTAAELESLCRAFDVRVMNQEYSELPPDIWPLWTLRHDKRDPESCAYFIGWQGTEIREKVMTSMPFENLVESVYQCSALDIVVLALSKVQEADGRI